MFVESFCVILALCGSVNSAEIISGTLTKKFPSDIQTKQHKVSKFHKFTPVIKNGDVKTKTIRKRGIVMVDSDFDIPSEIYTYENSLDTRDMFEKSEGSGTSENDDLFKDTEEDITTMSNFQKIMNISTSTTQSTTERVKSTTANINNVTSINIEGSGDDESLLTEKQFTSTKEMSTEGYTTPTYDIQEKIPDICMNSTCDENDLFIFTSEERTNVAEGINFTLTCKNHNNSLDTMLYWYKSNGSEYFLQTLGTNEQLHLNIPNTKLIHSGMYVCVRRLNKENCCNVKSDLIIYEVPLYQYHLVIIGLITLIGIALCIFLSVRQSIVLKKYTKEFAEKHGKMKNLL